VLGLPCLDEEQASLQFGTKRIFYLMDGKAVEAQIEERRPNCLLMSSFKVQKMMRKTRRSMGRNADFYVINVSPTAQQPTEFHIGEELTAKQRDNFRSLIDYDFPKLLQPVNSPHVSRQCVHPIETIGPMKRHRLNMLSSVESDELSRHLKDTMQASLTCVWCFNALRSTSSAFRRWNILATLCQLVKFPFRQRKSRLLETGKCLRGKRRIAVCVILQLLRKIC
jgi:hypothetical protein